MTVYTPAERTMLLLFARLGEERPLAPGVYRTMFRTLEALGPSGEPDRDLDGAELKRLGVHPEAAEAILRRLEQKAALDRHLDALDRLGVTAVTRVSPSYPQRLRQVLGIRAPMVLYCAGNLKLFSTPCVSLVGSRRLREPGRHFSETLGREAARQARTYCSGGAQGADTAGYLATADAGGSAVLFLPESLRVRMEQMSGQLRRGRLLLAAEGLDEPFSVANAYARNRLIHAMGQQVFVAQSDYGAGGTWQGVLENLKNSWSPVYMNCAEPEDPGTRGLIERGCSPVSAEDLTDLRALNPIQTNLFEK